MKFLTQVHVGFDPELESLINQQNEKNNQQRTFQRSWVVGIRFLQNVSLNDFQIRQGYIKFLIRRGKD